MIDDLFVRATQTHPTQHNTMLCAVYKQWKMRNKFHFIWNKYTHNTNTAHCHTRTQSFKWNDLSDMPNAKCVRVRFHRFYFYYFFASKYLFYCSAALFFFFLYFSYFTLVFHSIRPFIHLSRTVMCVNTSGMVCRCVVLVRRHQAM